MRRSIVLVATALAIACAACGSSSSSGSSGRAPEPAGAKPSSISLAVCAHMAQSELARVLGVKASVEGRSWLGHRYSCNYVYPNGTIGVSVQELSSWNQTLGYYDSLAQQLGKSESLGNLGQGAFKTTNGDVVVRKDWKVLLVNISGLPQEFGSPPTSAPDVAYTVADIILACWAGD